MKCYHNGKIFLRDLERKKESSGHFFVDDVYCRYRIIDPSLPVIITFNALLTDIKAPTYHKVKKGDVYPWGYQYVQKLGLNVISFMPIQAMNWYRSLVFHALLEKAGNYLNQFETVRGYGGSMGGYAVSAFSEILSMNEMLLLNPISTLNKSLAPFETRETFRKYHKYNWFENYFDGADTNVPGYIVYDPIFHIDVMHANRYKNLVHLKLPGVGHSMPMHLQRLGMLKWMSKSFLKEGTIDKVRFYREARSRRKYSEYYSWLLSEQNIHLTPKREYIIRQTARREGIRGIVK